MRTFWLVLESLKIGIWHLLAYFWKLLEPYKHIEPSRFFEVHKRVESPIVHFTFHVFFSILSPILPINRMAPNVSDVFLPFLVDYRMFFQSGVWKWKGVKFLINVGRWKSWRKLEKSRFWDGDKLAFCWKFVAVSLRRVLFWKKISSIFENNRIFHGLELTKENNENNEKCKKYWIRFTSKTTLFRRNFQTLNTRPPRTAYSSNA